MEAHALTAAENRRRINKLRAGEGETRGKKTASGGRKPRQGKGKR